MSSMRSAGGAIPGTGSDIPVPRLSSRISRENEEIRRRKRANGGCSQLHSTWERNPGT